MLSNAEKTMEESKTFQERDAEQFAKDLQKRRDFEGALETLRRFREMVGAPRSAPMPQTTRGTWTKPESDSVGWKPRV